MIVEAAAAVDIVRDAPEHAGVPRPPAPKPTPGPRRSSLLLGVLALAGCRVTDQPSFARPALVAPVAEVPCPELVELQQHGPTRQTGLLVAADEEVHFELRRVADDGVPRSLVLLVPILAGGKELMSVVAQRMLGEGFDVAFCERAGSALTAPQRGPELEELFRRTVLHQRLLLAWLRSRDDAARHVHVLGLSMGGIISTVLAAEEPTLDRVAVCLAGADLPRMVLVTSERRVHSWLNWRRETDGFGADTLRWELQQFLRHEPARFAPRVPTDKVLFVSASLDTVVPKRNQQLLWEALGRPRRLVVPFGHYTAALAMDRVIHAAANHFRGAE